MQPRRWVAIPELLADLEQKRFRVAELSALFAEADEEDYNDADDTGVLPSDQVKALRAEIKEAKAQAKLAKKDKRDPAPFLAQADVIDKRLARHKALEDEGKQLKAEILATEKRRDDLVAAARAKIGGDAARAVILDRMHRLIGETYTGYLRADERMCASAVANLHAKYAVTAVQIENARDEAMARLKAFQVELGYA